MWRLFEKPAPYRMFSYLDIIASAGVGQCRQVMEDELLSMVLMYKCTPMTYQLVDTYLMSSIPFSFFPHNLRILSTLLLLDSVSQCFM